MGSLFLRARPRPRLLAGAGVSAAVLAGLLTAPASATEEPSEPAPAISTPTSPAAEEAQPEPVHTFLSAPDLLNGDIGDVRSSPYWKPGKPNSWNASWSRNISNVFGQLAATGADSYLVAGDLVDGHWHVDKTSTGIFGPGRNRAQELRRITRAGNLYYPEWLRFWSEAGVPRWRVHTAVGDHEVGDNPWPTGSTKYAGFEHFKSVYARHLTRSKDGTRSRYQLRPTGTKFDDTAYATYLAPEVLLVTVDVFDRRRGGVRATVNAGQLAWLDRTLAEARQRPDDVTVIVQGHTPALGPVRQRSSSGLMLEEGNGERGAFWETLRRHDVDLYFAGEVHDFTAIQRGPGEPVQISHGGYAATGRTDFMVGEVYADGSISLDARTIDREWRSEATLWQTNRQIVPRFIRMAPTSRSVGTLSLSGDGTITARTGDLDVWS